jgi:natural product biosynthesis luciferase-like monooxygenase protein
MSASAPYLVGDARLAEAERCLAAACGARRVTLTPSRATPGELVAEIEGLRPAAGPPLDFGLFYFSDNEDPSGQDNYRLFLQGVQQADELGFKAVWTPERHFTAVGAASPNPSVLSAAVAPLTRQIQLRSGSVVLPLHHPVRVAEEWAVVDRLSNGRVGLSFASGWVPDDFIFAPDTYACRGDTIAGLIGQVRALWRGELLVFRNGVGAGSEIRIRPRPVQPELPVWVTAASSAATFALAGQIGANILTATLNLSLEQIAENLTLYRDARARAGYDPASGIATVMLHTYVTPDAEAARAEAARHLHAYFKAQTALRQAVARDLGRDLAGTERYMDRIVERSVQRYLDDKSLIGSPESCAPMVARLKAAGASEVACLIDFGVPADRVLDALPSLNRLRLEQAPPSLGVLQGLAAPHLPEGYRLGGLELRAADAYP